jgi:flagellar assembly protein FliH
VAEFKRLDIKEDPSVTVDGRVVKVDSEVENKVSSFTYKKISRRGDGDYQNTKRKFGSLAATDVDRKLRSRKDSRFSLNPLLRAPLAIDEEEKQAVQKRVEEGLKLLSDEAKETARKTGYEEGLKGGYDEAYKKYREEGKSRLEQFEKFLNSCEEAKKEIFMANEKFIIDLIVRISKKIILRELEDDKEYLVRLVRELLDRVGTSEQIRIYINEADLENATLLKEDLKKRLGKDKNFHIETSDEVQQNGCKVETEWNSIDANIETQLNGVFDALSSN